MKGTLHQTNYGWVVRYVKSNNEIVHLPVHPDDQDYIFEKDHGLEVIFDTEIHQDVTYRPTISESYSRMTARIIGLKEITIEDTNTEEESLLERLDRIEKKSKQYDDILDDLLNRINISKGINKIREKELTEIDQIYEMLVKASAYGLEAEVVMSALMSMRRDPNQTLLEAMQAGMEEWIK